MKKFTEMTADEFVAIIQAEEKHRDREARKSKGSGVKPSKKRLKRRNR
ncbi:MAG: hypothetical protein L0196_01245 [candidate division Zixibacteria bacterium]|nr:hypothetical protein [candidate division Zixibacteria bacterium]